MKTLRRFLFVMAPVLVVGVWGANAATNYVWQDSPNPTPPYSSWDTAAHVIQDAVDSAADGDTVMVTNGVYRTGGKPIHVSMTNRVAVDKPLTLMSVNGPEVTIIEGKPPALPKHGIRCVYLSTNASLTGFTLTNGYGPGICGGVEGGTLTNCTLIGNHAYHYRIPFTTYGGGAFRSILYNCTLMDNSADMGGGALDSTLYNCSVTGNSATRSFGGCWNSALTNCILYFNTAPDQPNYDTNSILAYTCTYPMPAHGVGNITNAPLFVDTNNWADLRLRPDSPCIDAGNNDLVTALMDLDGNPRIINGVVDMGAYEFQPLTPSELVLHLAEMVANSDLKKKRPLLASLEAALASIERGSHYSTIGQLGAFQNKVGAQVYRSDPALAVELIEVAQQVMGALNHNP